MRSDILVSLVNFAPLDFLSLLTKSYYDIKNDEHKRHLVDAEIR